MTRGPVDSRESGRYSRALSEWLVFGGGVVPEAHDLRLDAQERTKLQVTGYLRSGLFVSGCLMKQRGIERKGHEGMHLLACDISEEVHFIVQNRCPL